MNVPQIESIIHSLAKLARFAGVHAHAWDPYMCGVAHACCSSLWPTRDHLTGGHARRHPRPHIYLYFIK